jgi:hypothetical protein
LVFEGVVLAEGQDSEDYLYMDLKGEHGVKGLLELLGTLGKSIHGLSLLPLN